MNLPKENDVYRHFKGQLYRIVAIAEHSETGEQLVIYKALYGEGKVYARPLEMFMGPVDKVKYPDAAQSERFEKVTDEILQKTSGASGTAVPQKAPDTLDTSDSSDTSDSEEKLDPKIDEFIMADTYEKKLEILYSVRNRITDEMLNTMAMICEVTLEEGTVEEKYESLKKALLIYEKYECNRLR